MNIIPADDFLTGLICLTIAIFFIALLVVARKDEND